MAGHSQFKNIMHKKGKQDAIRSKLFSKLAREITVAAKLGLPDPAMNARLRAAVIAARARKHAQGQYRARDQEGVGRRQRDLRRSALRGLRAGRRRGHRRGADRQPQPHRRRSALLFHQGGRRRSPKPARCRSCSTASASIVFDRKVADDDAMLEAAIEAGADDVVSGPEEHEVITAVEALREAQKALEAKFGEPRKAVARLAAAEHDRGRRRGGREDPAPDRRARGQRRRSDTSPRISRFPTR